MSKPSQTGTSAEHYFSKTVLLEVFEEYIAKQKAKGTDGTTPQAFSDKLDQEADLIGRKALSGVYRFSRYREKLVSKGAGKNPRELVIPTVRDRLVLRCLLELLSDLFPEAKVKKPHSYIKKLKTTLSTCNENATILRIDIKDFYPTINHRKLISTLKKRIKDPYVIELLKAAVGTSSSKGNLKAVGIPQGLSISNILANIYFLKLDTEFSSRYGEGHYFRYVDDIVILLNDQNPQSEFSWLKKRMRLLGLRVHELGKEKSKTLISNPDQGVEYLGFVVKRNSVAVRRSSLNKMYDKIAAVVTSGVRSEKTPRMLFKLNLKITGCRVKGKRYGWLHFFQQTEDVQQLANLDSFVRKQLSRITKLSDDYKPARFVKAYYEIKFNSLATSYIPDFDVKTIEQKREILARLSMPRIGHIDSLTDGKVTELFDDAIGKLVQELEQDLLEPTS